MLLMREVLEVGNASASWPVRLLATHLPIISHRRACSLARRPFSRPALSHLLSLSPAHHLPTTSSSHPAWRKCSRKSSTMLASKSPAFTVSRSKPMREYSASDRGYIGWRRSWGFRVGSAMQRREFLSSSREAASRCKGSSCGLKARNRTAVSSRAWKRPGSIRPVILSSKSEPANLRGPKLRLSCRTSRSARIVSAKCLILGIGATCIRSRTAPTLVRASVSFGFPHAGGRRPLEEHGGYFRRPPVFLSQHIGDLETVSASQIGARCILDLLSGEQL